MSGKRITLSDIARRAETSAMAVSVALNGARSNTRVSDATRRRTTEIAAHLNYSPNAMAQGLKRRRTRTVGVLFNWAGSHAIHDLYSAAALDGVVKGAAGYHVLLYTTSWKNAAESSASFSDRRTDGVIVVAFRRAGTPAAWISLKNYPGQHPILTSDAWNTIKIGRGSSKEPSTAPALAYLEVRGLHIRGNAESVQEKPPDLIDKVDPLTNGNGISGSGGDEVNKPHHLRFADNLIEYCCGGGVGTGDCDGVTIENNTVCNNCWWVIYATSGIGLLGTQNFDATDNVYKSLRGCRVDIINNTAYYNGASPELNWGQMFVQESDDMHVVNNILVSRPGQPINSVGSGGDDQNSTNVVRASNIYFGGLAPKLTGANDVIADPLFVNLSTDFKTADFHLRANSPAIRAGARLPVTPFLDLDGKPRPVATSPDRGAYQYGR